MKPGLILGGNTDIRVGSVTIKNGDVGIHSYGKAHVQIDRAEFDNVQQPYDIQGGSASIGGTPIINDPKIDKRLLGMGGSRNKSWVGYIGKNGPPLPSQCPKCNTIFPSRNYDIGSSSFYGFDNEETCPECGYEHAKVASGLFNLAKEAIEILQAEPLTHALVQALAAAADDYINGKADIEETISRVEAASSGLGQVLRKARAGGPNLATYLALWFLFFPSHLEPVHEVLGEAEPRSDSRYQIERICLELFGELAKCRVTFEPVQDVDSPSQAQVDQVAKPTAPEQEQDPDARSEIEGCYPQLPDEGPVPEPAPD